MKDPPCGTSRNCSAACAGTGRLRHTDPSSCSHPPDRSTRSSATLPTPTPSSGGRVLALADEIRAVAFPHHEPDTEGGGR